MAMKKRPSATPPAPLTLEEKIQQAVDRDKSMDSYALQRLPIPLNGLAVGEEVYLGHLDDAVVVAVIEDGRRLAVQHAAPRRRDNDGDPTERFVMVVPAIEVQRKSDRSIESFSNPKNILLHYSQRDISGLIGMITGFGVDMNPEYQRELVWDESDKVRLIDSIFNQVDIGKFVFRHLPFVSEHASYEVVDGKQRLNALIDYMSDKFPYKGKNWSQLSRVDRQFIESFPVSYAQLPETYTRAQILELFVRLNTGGRPMDPNHLEKVAKLASEATEFVKPKSAGPKR